MRRCLMIFNLVCFSIIVLYPYDVLAQISTTKATGTQTNIFNPFAATTDLNNTPRIFVPHSIYDFGVVMEKRYLFHEFKIYNKGKGVLKILNVTYLVDAPFGLKDFNHRNFPVGKIEISPGSVFFVRVGIAAQGRPGRDVQIIGQVITLTTNDSLHKKVELKVKYTAR
jgi:hypothetical protein